MEKIVAILCGKMRKRVFVNMKDIVLVSIRDFQDDKCDIIDLYDDTLVHQLKSGNHIPDFINTKEDNEFCEEIDGGIEFTMEVPEEEDLRKHQKNSEEIDLDDI